MPSDWERHSSGILFRTRRSERTGETLYQIDSHSTEWLNKLQFDAQISGLHPREIPRTPHGAGRGDYRLFPADDPDQTAQVNADRTFNSFTSDAGPHYEHAPRHDEGQGLRDDGYRPQLTSLGQAVVRLKMGDYKGLGQFVLKYPMVVAQPEINSLLVEAANALRAGKEGLAETYVHHAVILQKCSKINAEERKFLFQDLDNRRDTRKDITADVNKAYSAIRSRSAAPQPPRQGGVTHDMGMIPAGRDHSENPQPRSIQRYEQGEPASRLSVERDNGLPNQSQLRRARDRDGRLVYVDSKGREVRPASDRQDGQRDRHTSEHGPPIAKMAHLNVDESRHSLGPETSSRYKGNGPTSPDPTFKQAGDSQMRLPSGEIQQRRKYTITGTEGDTERLDADYKKRPNSKDFFKQGKVFALLWHQSSGNKPKFELSKEISVTRGRFGEEIYSSIRRMVVVKEGHGHCWCLMINTYNEQGVLKSGLSADDRKKHTVVYMTGNQPTRLRDEHLLNKQPIAVDPASADQKLHEMSRLDFRRVYTVEHNVKVKDIGRVSQRSMPYLITYWKDVVNNP